MSDYKNVRGTHDLYGEILAKFLKIEKITRLLAYKYGFDEIRTPIFEFSNVFKKNIGEQTDIIGKEMYVFEDRNGEQMALRPEGTAPVVRSLISNGLTHKLPLKYFYIGPMFRYERPQKGRQRQFHQLGFEYLGTNSYCSDVEMINLALDILKELGINSYKLLINSLGSKESLNNYKKALVDFLQTKKQLLSEYSMVRLENNPLRVLDSKDSKDREVILSAPKIADYLTDNDKDFFNKIKNTLKYLSIDFIEDSSLVRGLDYYNHTVFEIITDDLGSQGTLIAGGRYNSMIQQMGGPDIGSFGFAGGLERLALMIDKGESKVKEIAILSAKDEYDNYSLQIARRIREEFGFSSSFMIGKDVSSKLKRITKEDFFAVIIIGEKEFDTKSLTIKDSIDFSSSIVAEKDIYNFLKSKYSKYKI